MVENGRIKIQRALLGVADKSGIVEFAKALAELGVELVSTGGTKATLEAANLKVRSVESITGFPELFDGRVKTLHPKIHGAILARRAIDRHRHQMREHGIEPIDLVAVNFYPFEKVISEGKASLQDAIENIDIGGPALVRAAAKNYADVVVVVDPSDYASVIAEMRANGGTVGESLRLKLARKAFRHVAFYDTAIASYFDTLEPDQDPLGSELLIAYRRSRELRYGENPHQKAALYGNFFSFVHQLHGKELSYNNVLDIQCAISLARDFLAHSKPMVAILKHNTPCGVALGADLREAWEKAFATDPDSPFGGIVVTTRPFDLKLAEAVDKIFTEVLVAPSFEAQALEFLKRKRDRRLVQVDFQGLPHGELEIRKIAGGLLAQSPDEIKEDYSRWQVVTKRRPSPEELEALKFAWLVCKHVKSNAVVFATKEQTLAIGGGATARVEAVHVAVDKAARLNISLKGSVMASEAFFPFPDGPKLAASAGATAIVQPGGSIRDSEVISTADELGIAMLFTGVRHFRH